jgi:hypothetical protein
MMNLRNAAGFIGLCLLLALPSLAVTDEELVDIAKRAASVAAQQPAAGHLKSWGLPSGSAAATQVAPLANIANFVTVGQALAPISQFQPTPCFGCLTTTANPNTLGLTLPLAFVPPSVSAVQYTFVWEDLFWNDLVTASFVILRGSTVIDVFSVSAPIFPSIWSFNWVNPPPAPTGTYAVVGILNYGTRETSSIVHFLVAH